MDPEDALIVVALAATLGTIGVLAHSLLTGRPAHRILSRLQWTLTIALSFALALLLYYFLTLHVEIEYVHSYTSKGTPWYYRMAGLWAGQKGTILLWTTAAAWILVVNDRLWRRREATPPGHLQTLTWILLIGLLVVAAFEALLLLQGTFAHVDPYLRLLYPNGRGLQPVLKTPFMVIHPPIQFVFYGLAVLLFACGLAGVLTRGRAWADIALPWTRLAFLLGTAGLGLGGLWAYYVLNFGGYWAWDPVETANLLAWFPVLLLLHALLYYRSRGMYEASAPIFAGLTLVMALFSTIATRTGLWVSVHAFTDPSKNFADDPLVRLLNILDTNLILRWLTSLFLAAVLGLLLAYVARLSHDATPSRPAARRILGAASGLLVALIALSFLDVRFTLSAIFEAADLVGFDRAPIGLAVFGFLAALIVAAPATPERPGPPEKGPWLDRYVQTPQLVFLGVLFLSLAFLVTFLLDILSVNGYLREHYDDRAPIVALPILLTMGVALGHPAMGRKNASLGAAAALVLGVAAALVDRSHWEVALLLPALAWALAGASTKLFKVSDLGAILDRRLRIAGGLLLFGGILTLVHWANPPSQIRVLSFEWQPSAWWAAPGFAFGLVAILTSVAVLRAKTVRAHRFGSAALVLGWGFGVGALLGVAAFALAESRRSRFPDAEAPASIRACAKDLRREIRKTGTYLIHVALVLGLTGIALSTYEQAPEAEVEIARGETGHANGYDFTLTGSRPHAFDAEQGQITGVSAILDVSRDGRHVGTYPLTMSLVLRQRYAEKVDVIRTTTEDVYLRPLRFSTPERNFTAGEEQVVLTSGQVDAVAFTVKALPGMHLVWAGLWTILAGMLIILAAGGARLEVAVPKHRPESAAPGPGTSGNAHTGGRPPSNSST